MKLLTALFFFACSQAFAIDLAIRPSRGTGVEDFFFSGMAESAAAHMPGQIVIRTHLSCFGTNLRYVSNPVSPMAAVMMNIGIGKNSDPMTLEGKGDLSIQFPGWMVWARQMAGGEAERPEDAFSLDTAGGGGFRSKKKNKIDTAYGTQNLVVMKPPVGLVDTGVTYDTTPGKNFGKAKFHDGDPLRYIKFSQNLLGRGKCFGPVNVQNFDPVHDGKWALAGLLSVFAKAGGAWSPLDDMNKPDNPNDKGWNEPTMCDSGLKGWDPAASGLNVAYYLRFYQRYIGVDGDLSGQWSYAWSSDYSTLDVYASFPGELGFCGGFFSPLMLFFGNKRPQLTRRANFEIVPGILKTAWPEAHPSWGFLVLDRNHDGVINDGQELFGADELHATGFEALREFDSNLDGVIDSRDPVFSKLRLWQDSTGLGKTLKKDLRTLKEMNVQSIDLNYTSNLTEPVPGGEFKQRSPFKFKSSKGVRRGQVIDVWFEVR